MSPFVSPPTWLPLVNTKMTMSQQCSLAAKNANSTLDCVRKKVTIRLKQVIFPLYSGLVRLHLEYCVKYKRDMHLPKQVKLRTTKVIKGWTIFHREAERAGTIQTGEEKAQGRS